MGCFYHFCPHEELRASPTEEDTKRCSKKRELDELRRSQIQEKGFTITEFCKCEWWKLNKTTTNVKQHVGEKFP